MVASVGRRLRSEDVRPSSPCAARTGQPSAPVLVGDDYDCRQRVAVIANLDVFLQSTYKHYVQKPQGFRASL